MADKLHSLIQYFNNDDSLLVLGRTLKLKIRINNFLNKHPNLNISHEYRDMIIDGSQMILTLKDTQDDELMKSLAESISNKLAKIIDVYNDKYGSISKNHIKDIQELISFSLADM